MYNEGMQQGYMIRDRGNHYYIYKDIKKAKQKLCEIASYLYNVINCPLSQEELDAIYYDEYFFFSDSRIEILNCWLGD